MTEAFCKFWYIHEEILFKTECCRGQWSLHNRWCRQYAMVCCPLASSDGRDEVDLPSIEVIKHMSGTLDVTFSHFREIAKTDY